VAEDGSPLSPRLARAFREQNAGAIEAFLARATERWNNGIDEMLTVHLATPDPGTAAEFSGRAFPVPRPDDFVPRSAGFLGLVWPPFRRRVSEANESRRQGWSDELAAWDEERLQHEADEARRKDDYERGRYSDTDSMERVLAERLAALDWPRETEVSFQVREGGEVCWLDVDLPEIEDVPAARAVPAARGLKVNVRKKSDTQVRGEYMQHIHGVLFRIIGEVFHCLPTVQQVVASGYSQRPDPATGHVRDDYLLSVRVQRDQWGALHFGNLAAIDVTASFEQMDLRRVMTKTGMFTPIEPHVEGVE
jgi:hypothetical protein